jgi:hypothetical protein
MFRLTALIALLGSSAALKVDSPEGQTLLAKSRGLEENNMNWMAAYSMVFQSCHTISSFNEEADENGKMVSYQNLVKYKMCSSESCKYGCSGGEYVADMATFVQSYYDWKMYDKRRLARRKLIHVIAKITTVMRMCATTTVTRMLVWTTVLKPRLEMM